MTIGGMRFDSRGWPELEHFENDGDADAVGSWWDKPSTRTSDFASQGREINDLVLEGDWCRRRVVNLHFLEERRGKWHSSVDFEVPSRMRTLELCKAGRGLIWLPLITYRKLLLPITHMHARDEQDGNVPTATSAISAQLAFAILIGNAERTSLDLSRAAPLLWRIACPNSVESERALTGLLRQWPGISTGERHTDRRKFLLSLRSLARSTLVVYELDEGEVGRQRVLDLYSDGPVRVSRRFWEIAGWRPLTVAPRVDFGGNADSYHMEIAPPEQLLVADSRLIFSYFDPGAGRSKGYELNPLQTQGRLGIRRRMWRWWVGGSLHRTKQQGDEEPLTTNIREESTKRYWDQVEGSAEPMTGHVRVAHTRLPNASQGRDVYAIFQLYPQYVGQLLQFLVAGGVNLVFLTILALGLDSYSMRQLVALHPEVLLVAALTVVGIGGGITIVPREHVLTTFVLKPQYVLIILVLTLASSATVLVFGRQWDTPNRWSLPPAAHDLLLGVASLAGLTWLLLAAITWNVRKAETRGTRYWRRIGLRFRLAQYRYGLAVDQRSSVAAETQSESEREEKQRERRMPGSGTSIGR